MKTLLPLLLLACVGVVQAMELQLNVEEYARQPGLRYVSCGVPLLQGQAQNVADLRLTAKDATGRQAPVPAQFRTLARWGRADNSIRWVLVDFQTDITPGGKQPFILTTEKLATPAPKQPVTVKETPDTITITTGPAKFEINRKQFNLLQQVWIDANGDGLFTDNEQLLESSTDTGLVLEDTYGVKYFAADGTSGVDVMEAGPLRVRLRARGRNLARAGQGYSKGLYGYDCFLDFFAGSSDVSTDVIVANNPPKSIGAPTFKDASLLLKLKGGGTEYALNGDQPQTGQLIHGESVCLYQDSNGADTWAECPGFGMMDSPGWSYTKGDRTSFRGYRVYQRRGTNETVLAGGDHAGGTAHLFNTHGGMVVHMKNLWQQFPKALEVAADGTMRIGLFPREFKVVHFLEDTSAKGHEIVLHFYTPGSASPYPKDAAGRPQLNALAGRWDSRAMLRPPIAHIAACGALADLGPFTLPVNGLDTKPDTRTAANGPRMFTTDQLYGNAYGWQVFGERWRSQGGHGKRGARQPIDQDNYLWRWYVTGLPEWFAAGDARSRHFRDVRCYRIDEQDPFGFKDWQAFRAANRNEDWTKRPQPQDEEYQKYSKDRWPRSEWLFPNPEHTTLDLLYDRYLLFGDERCLENMRIAAAHGGYFAGRGGEPMHGAWPWRANGWGWRALLRYWDLTGDKAAETCLRDVMNTHAAYIGKTPFVSFNDEKKDDVNWWFTGIYCRAVGMTALLTGDKRMLDLCKTLAVKPQARQGNKVPTLFAVLYHLTGDTEYQKAVFKDGKGEDLLKMDGYFTACDHWLLTQPSQAEGKPD